MTRKPTRPGNNPSPPWLPFRRGAGKRPWILGHRGARAHAPENTREAFERALADGADGVELDVRMNSSGVLYISHDEVPDPEIATGRPLMTLDQVLQLQQESGAIFNIELKGDVPAPLDMARRVAAMVMEHGGAGLLLSSFSPRQVAVLHKALPHVPVCQLVAKEAWLSLRLRALPLMGLAGVNLRAGLLTARLMQTIRPRFPLINTWTVNSPEEARRVADLGVDAIITDDPGLILGEFR